MGVGFAQADLHCLTAIMPIATPIAAPVGAVAVAMTVAAAREGSACTMRSFSCAGVPRALLSPFVFVRHLSVRPCDHLA